MDVAMKSWPATSIEELERLAAEYSAQINRYRGALMWIAKHSNDPGIVARAYRELGTGPQA
jgi:hypothetical protein